MGGEVITGEVGAASPPVSRRVPSSAVPLPVRLIRPRHIRTRTRLVHTQITRIADFERPQHDDLFESRLLIGYVLLAVGYTLCTMALLWPRERSVSTQLSLRSSGHAATRRTRSPASPLP